MTVTTASTGTLGWTPGVPAPLPSYFRVAEDGSVTYDGFRAVDPRTDDERAAARLAELAEAGMEVCRGCINLPHVSILIVSRLH